MSALLSMNTHPTQTEPADKPQGKLRFTYGSGSRPLDGYTIKRGVGRGGFGEVYYAVSDAGKDVALKLIRRNLEVELRGVKHCLNLKHPNLLDIYDIRTDENDDRWVVMEYVSGAALDDVIALHPEGMPVDMAVEWFRGICEGVAYLHDHGIVHRDLKPGNIFIDDGRVKIGDYGLSKFISCSRRSGQTESVGTVHYMAPEIANGRYGREIDVYAVGIILFEMLTGHVPFEGESVGEVLMKHLTAEPDLTRLNDPFRAIIAGAMAKDPEHRTHDVAAMLQRIDVAVGSAVTQAYNAEGLASAMAGAAGGGAAGAAAAQAAAGAAHAKVSPGANSPRPVGGAPRHAGSGTPRPEPYAQRPDANDPEPVAQFVKDMVAPVADLVHFREWPKGVRIALAIIAAIAAINLLQGPDGEELAFMAAMVGGAYLVYRGIRTHLIRRELANFVAANPLPVSTPATPTSSPQSGTPAGRENRAGPQARRVPGITRPWRRRQATWQSAVRQHLRNMSARDRWTDTLGAMIVAVVVGAMISILACTFAAPQPGFEMYLWMVIVTVFGSWTLMVPCKLFEARVEDQAPLRFAQLFGGALVGIVASAIAAGLMLQLPTSTDVAPGPWDSLSAELFRQPSSSSLHGALNDQVRQSGRVTLPPQMYVAYFAFLFVLLRWWRMADVTRRVRVNFWSIAWTAFVAWLLTFFWWFPQPAGMLVAACIAFTVQLSSPWMSPERRTELAEQAIV